MNRGTSQATVHGVTKSQTQVSNLARTHLVVTNIAPKMISQEEKLKSAQSDHPARWLLFPRVLFWIVHIQEGSLTPNMVLLLLLLPTEHNCLLMP